MVKKNKQTSVQGISFCIEILSSRMMYEFNFCDLQVFFSRIFKINCYLYFQGLRSGGNGPSKGMFSGFYQSPLLCTMKRWSTIFQGFYFSPKIRGNSIFQFARITKIQCNRTTLYKVELVQAEIFLSILNTLNFESSWTLKIVAFETNIALMQIIIKYL